MSHAALSPKTKKVTLAAVALAATGVVAGATILPMTTASAATGTGTIATGAGVPLSVNDAPRLQSNRTGWVRSGERIKISCQVHGDAVNGPWGRNSLWNYIQGRGYVSDSWTNTGTNGRIPGVPDCNAAKPAKPAAKTGVVATVGVPLSVNPAPRLNVARTGWAQPGERVPVDCQAYGDWVDGKWGRTNLWSHIPGRGYVSDGWLDTGTNGRIKGVPLCAGSSQPTQPPRPTEPPASGYQYPYTGKMRLPFKKGAGYPVTQTPFGSYTHNRNHPIGAWNMHAIDFGTPGGTPLYAPGPGKVVYAGWDNTGYGNKILIDHGNNRCTILAHLSGISVKRGDKLTAGAYVGTSGNSGGGYNTGYHLHYGIINCQTGRSSEIPNTVEAGTSYHLNRTYVSANNTR